MNYVNIHGQLPWDDNIAIVSLVRIIIEWTNVHVYPHYTSSETKPWYLKIYKVHWNWIDPVGFKFLPPDKFQSLDRESAVVIHSLCGYLITLGVPIWLPLLGTDEMASIFQLAQERMQIKAEFNPLSYFASWIKSHNGAPSTWIIWLCVLYTKT